MKKETKKVLMSFIVILILIFVILLILLVKLQKTINNQEEENVLEEIGGSILDDYVGSIEDSLSRSAYFDINTCMAQYLNTLNLKKSSYYGYNENGEFALIIEQNEIKEKIYNMLSNKYAEENNITIDNVYNYVETNEVQTIYVPLEAKLLQSGEIQSFITHGLVENTRLEVIDEVFAVVNINKKDNIFSVEPIYGEYTSIKEIQVEHLEERLTANGDNKFQSISISSEEVVKDYINIYKRLALGGTEELYNRIDEEYRNIRFESLEEFKRYIKESSKSIKSIRIEKYKTNSKDNYKEYVCIDQNSNYYIFKEISPLNYTIILDNYTIPTQDFIEKYNSSLEEEKGILNIERFLMGINDKNYGYSYSVLSDSFKNNKYHTKEEFVKYVQDNFFEENEIKHVEYKKENGLYIYEIKITDATGKSQEEKMLNMVIKLKNGTDFEMSFGEN